MARVALRAYQREIEELIETHQYDQAIAHCKHTLKFYPKEVHTYRLLGKAYLESQRYGDASDIFMRVLSSVPDDFVSHVGMSIIREDEGNLDDAIWHMERAFEAQPANSAIQGELRRLHGRREGIEPPKIRLTRGALARMYIKGELYSQAIAELRAGLHEHPKRYDLQVVLANAYYVTGQRVDAVDICSSLIKALPYCLEANRILSEILSASERTEEAQVYAKRVYSLDPYSAHITPSTPTADLVSEAAVTLEKLEWRPGSPISETSEQPEWAASLGVSLGDSKVGKDSMPDWLSEPISSKSDETSEAVKPFAESEISESTDDLIPDWMQEAGWGSSTGVLEQDTSFQLEENNQVEGAELSPAEIPDWLQTMAPETPSGQVNELSELDSTTASSDDDAHAVSHPWLDENPPGPTDSVVTWLERSDAPNVQESQLDPTPSDPLDVPDWLHDFESAATIGPLDELDSLPTLHEEIIDKEHSSEYGDFVQIESLAGVESFIPSQDASTSLDELLDTVPSGDQNEVLAQDEPKSGDISDWLQGFDSPDSEEAPELSETTENLPAWLIGLGDEVGSANLEESPVDIQSFSTEEIPVEAPSNESAQTSDVESPEESIAAQIQTSAGEPLEDDAAFAWLESLAVKQGADEALLLDPEDRRNEPPAWVQSESTETESSQEIEKPGDVPPEPELELEAEPEMPDLAPTMLGEATDEAIIYEAVEHDSVEPIFDEEDANAAEKVEQVDDIQERMIGSAIPAAGVALAAATLIHQDPEQEPDFSESAMLLTPSEPGEPDVMSSPPLESIPIDEGKIIEGDTQPTIMKLSIGESLATDSLDSEIAEMKSDSEADIQSPESPVDHVDTEELPEWVFESDEQVSIAEELPRLSVEVELAESTIDEPQELDDEEAFSWLEALAAKQQSDELYPQMSDTASDEPPSWIAQAYVETEKERPETEEGHLPEWLLENAPESADIIEEQPVEEDIPEWLITTTTLQEDDSTGDTPVGAPELPSWLAGIEEEENTEVDTEWVPSDEAFEEPLSEFLEEELVSEEPVVLETEIQAAPIDLNQAGLGELERLPGIGFVKAQAIMDYRDEQGPFGSTDELMNVSGIGPELLQNLRDNIFVTHAETTMGMEQPAEDTQISLLQARNALVQGNIALALEHYLSLIQDKEVLPEVISDLNEALYRFPVDVSIWETLGDAHVQAGRLQEALNAYSKAEDYLK